MRKQKNKVETAKAASAVLQVVEEKRDYQGEFADVFKEELEEIRERREVCGLPAPSKTAGTAPSADQGLVGLALSGGGIRSASFSLGVVQALAGGDAKEGSCLEKIDYLSTVSGGGYLGACLSSLLGDKDAKALTSTGFPLRKLAGEEEPSALKHLRNGSNYLTSSGSTLGLLALVVRGVLLTFVALLPMIYLAVFFTGLLYEELDVYLMQQGSSLRDYVETYWHLGVGGSAALFAALGALFPFVMRVRPTLERRALYLKVMAFLLQVTLLLLVLRPALALVEWAAYTTFADLQATALGLWKMVKPEELVTWGAIGSALAGLAGMMARRPRVLRGVGLGLAAVAGPFIIFATYLMLCIWQVQPVRRFPLDVNHRQTENLSIEPKTENLSIEPKTENLSIEPKTENLSIEQKAASMAAQVMSRDKGEEFEGFVKFPKTKTESVKQTAASEAAQVTSRDKGEEFKCLVKSPETETWSVKPQDDDSKLMKSLKSAQETGKRTYLFTLNVLSNDEHKASQHVTYYTVRFSDGKAFRVEAKTQGDGTIPTPEEVDSFSGNSPRFHSDLLSGETVHLGWVEEEQQDGKKPVQTTTLLVWGSMWDAEGMWLLALTALSLLLNTLFLNVNHTSPHGFYRDQLSRVFLRKWDKDDEEDDKRKFNDTLKLSKLRTRPDKESSAAPYHLINATVNLSEAQDLRGRHGDFFFFSKHYIGGKTTGWLRTEKVEKLDPCLDLGTAMAISAAAASPNMGVFTSRALSCLLMTLNVRLGYWLPNPKAIHELTKEGKLRRWLFLGPGPLCLWKEALRKFHAGDHYINVSDGGHIENLGVYELLRRHCRLIIAVDGEADPKMGFNGLGTLSRFARIDLGVTIQFEGLEDLRKGEGYSKAHWAKGTIDYGNGKQGTLLYIKSSLTGNEAVDLLAYHAAHPEFPHESTADQFFSEEQFEVYRALGKHIAEDPELRKVLLEELGAAVRTDTGRAAA